MKLRQHTAWTGCSMDVCRCGAADYNAGFAAGMMRAAELCKEKRAEAMERMREIPNQRSPGWNQYLGIHDGAGELMEEIAAEAEQEETKK